MCGGVLGHLYMRAAPRQQPALKHDPLLLLRDMLSEGGAYLHPALDRLRSVRAHRRARGEGGGSPLCRAEVAGSGRGRLLGLWREPTISGMRRAVVRQAGAGAGRQGAVGVGAGMGSRGAGRGGKRERERERERRERRDVWGASSCWGMLVGAGKIASPQVSSRWCLDHNTSRPRRSCFWERTPGDGIAPAANYFEA